MNKRMLGVSLLLCAVMALTVAAPTAGEHVIVKRWARCPNGWNDFFGNCYKVERTARAWADAEKVCLSQGGNLASIQSKAEYTFIQDLIRSSTGTNTHAWVGGYDATKNGVWLWSDGRPMTFTYWSRGNPDNWHGIQHCILINWSRENLWDDENCGLRRASVCKKQATAQ